MSGPGADAFYFMHPELKGLSLLALPCLAMSRKNPQGNKLFG